MNSAQLALIIQYVQAGIAAAPAVVTEVKRAKTFFSDLFGSGAITIERQRALHAHVDAIQAAVMNGDTPPQWTVEADPS